MLNQLFLYYFSIIVLTPFITENIFEVDKFSHLPISQTVLD